MLRLCGPTCDNLSVGLSIRQDKTTDQSYSNCMRNLPVCVASHHLVITYTDLCVDHEVVYYD